LTRGRSCGGWDSCGRFDQGLGEGVEGVQALKELSDSGCVVAVSWLCPTLT